MSHAQAIVDLFAADGRPASSTTAGAKPPPLSWSGIIGKHGP